MKYWRDDLRAKAYRVPKSLIYVSGMWFGSWCGPSGPLGSAAGWGEAPEVPDIAERPREFLIWAQQNSRSDTLILESYYNKPDVINCL